ncbi:homeobox protein HD-10-like [Trichosurus vulpecula]|uniref:homeobox protein HD-10-like n=1 Tax=Trichosurus vulpecula TaxID=9337 RepID=UPI00186B41E8|nr:homeobox protein HD-10-like [Trichosurus vulpecula]
MMNIVDYGRSVSQSVRSTMKSELNEKDPPFQPTTLDYSLNEEEKRKQDNVMAFRRKIRKKRKNEFSEHQLKILKEHFNRNPYIHHNQAKVLSAETGLTPIQIRYWFGNQRAKMRKREEWPIRRNAQADSVLEKNHLHSSNWSSQAFSRPSSLSRFQSNPMQMNVYTPINNFYQPLNAYVYLPVFHNFSVAGLNLQDDSTLFNMRSMS